MAALRQAQGRELVERHERLPLQTTAEIGSMRCCQYMEAREREALWQAYSGSRLIGKFSLEDPLPAGGAVERCEQMPTKNHHGHG